MNKDACGLLCGNLLGNAYYQNQEEDERIALRLISVDSFQD
jgi:hypothetical protein